MSEMVRHGLLRDLTKELCSTIQRRSSPVSKLTGNCQSSASESAGASMLLWTLGTKECFPVDFPFISLMNGENHQDEPSVLVFFPQHGCPAPPLAQNSARCWPSAEIHLRIRRWEPSEWLWLSKNGCLPPKTDTMILPSGNLTTIENGNVEWVFPLKMMLFNSYVKLPEGICLLIASIRIFGSLFDSTRFTGTSAIRVSSSKLQFPDFPNSRNMGLKMDVARVIIFFACLHGILEVNIICFLNEDTTATAWCTASVAIKIMQWTGIDHWIRRGLPFFNSTSNRYHWTVS